MGVWFGIITGLGEVSILVFRKFYQRQIIFHGLDVAWMAPVSDAILFGMLGLLFAVVARGWPQLNLGTKSIFVFLCLGFVSVLLMMFAYVQNYALLILAAGLAAQLSNVVKARFQGFNSVVRYTTPGLLFLVLSTAVFVHGMRFFAERRLVAALPVSKPHAPNILLIVWDTIRAENLSLYGYKRETTPNLERLAKSGVVFEKAISTSPWTLPSHASIFTGRYPHELSTNWWRALDTKYPTVAETLSNSGYLTGGFVANFWYGTYELGLSRGFVHYEDYGVSPGDIFRSSQLVRSVTGTRIFRYITNYCDTLGRKSARRINDAFLRWLSTREVRPFFAFINYFDAHDPYLAPEPYNVRFGPENDWRDPLIIDKWRQTANPISERELAAEIDAYDGTIAYMDQQLGRLLEELKRRSLIDNTLVIITSDHGEQFGEHGLYHHSNSLYRPLLHVPLVIAFPPAIPEGIRIPVPVSLIDIAATIGDIIELPDTGKLPGQSLSRYWNDSFMDGPQESKTPLFSEVRKNSGPQRLPFTKGDMKSLLMDGLHYIRNGDGQEELYDFDNDPAETQDLSNDERGRRVLGRFRGKLNEIIVKPRDG
jgi:arylsulfatase A-like enzyme